MNDNKYLFLDNKTLYTDEGYPYVIDPDSYLETLDTPQFHWGDVKDYKGLENIPVASDEGYLTDYIKPIGVNPKTGNVITGNGKEYELIKDLDGVTVTGHQPVFNKVSQEILKGMQYWKDHPDEFKETAKDAGKMSLDGAAIISGNPWILAADGAVNYASENGVLKTKNILDLITHKLYNEGKDVNDPEVQDLYMLLYRSMGGDVLDLSLMIPFVGQAYKYCKDGYNVVKDAAISKYGEHFFIPKEDSFTRGIGTESGLQDLVLSGIVRGNPKGTGMTPRHFNKVRYKGRDSSFWDPLLELHPDILNHYYNLNLTEDEWNALKKSYDTFEYHDGWELPLEDGVRILRHPVMMENQTYLDYLKNGEGHFLLTWDLYHPESEGNPPPYFYDDGRNMFGDSSYNYATSKYGVRLNNASLYEPYIPNGHLHMSVQQPVFLQDPNVEVFKRGWFGIPVKMNKEDLIWMRDNFDLPDVRYDIGTQNYKYKDFFNDENNKFEKFMYKDLMSGTESFPGEFKYIPDKYKGVHKSTPQESLEILLNSTLPRMQQMRPWMDPKELRSAVQREIDRGYTLFPDETWKKAGYSDHTTGFTYDKNGNIAIRDFSGEDEGEEMLSKVMVHEPRHNLLVSLFRTEEEENILKNSYEDLDAALKSSDREALRSYNRAEDEWETLNSDARIKLLGPYYKANKSLEMQNAVIKLKSDLLVVNAMKNADGYGAALVDYYIKKFGSVPKEKILAWRNSMIKVGVALPFVLGSGDLLFNKYNDLQQ